MSAKKKKLLLIVLLKERFTSKTVIWLTNENLGLKIHLSSLLIPFLGLLATYHDLIYIHIFLLRKLERQKLRQRLVGARWEIEYLQISG